MMTPEELRLAAQRDADEDQERIRAAVKVVWSPETVEAKAYGKSPLMTALAEAAARKAKR